MVIYKTTNLINGKFYIGQDSKNNPEYLGSGVYFKRAIKKYGRENFKKEILEYCETKEELNEREIYWIEKLNAIKEGYNIGIGGEGGDNFTNNPNKELIRKKISKSLEGHNTSEDTKKKQSSAKKNVKLSKEHCKNISLSKIAEKNSMFGKKQSIDTLIKRSNSMIGKNIGKKRSDEFKKNRSKKYLGNGNPMFGKIRNDVTEYNKEKNRKEYKIISDNNEYFFRGTLHELCDKYGLWYQDVVKYKNMKIPEPKRYKTEIRLHTCKFVIMEV